MTRIQWWLHAALIAGVVASAALSASAEPPLTVFLVRHAEKEANGADPSLTAAGRQRAEALAAMLADAGITAIFTSEFKRTQETAAPLAKRSGLSVTVVPGKDVDALLAKVRALPPGARALIVGHSNTVPDMATRLTGVKVADLGDTDFDRLYVGTIRKEGQGEVLLLHYGGAGAAPPAH
jgi:2,3-bisphosphoglycerate-dependent phosphoglycerate mutase